MTNYYIRISQVKSVGVPRFRLLNISGSVIFTPLTVGSGGFSVQNLGSEVRSRRLRIRYKRVGEKEGPRILERSLCSEFMYFFCHVSIIINIRFKYLHNGLRSFPTLVPLFFAISSNPNHPNHLNSLFSSQKIDLSSFTLSLYLSFLGPSSE